MSRHEFFPSLRFFCLKIRACLPVAPTLFRSYNNTHRYRFQVSLPLPADDLHLKIPKCHRGMYWVY
jgi:hypothetical protein